MHPSITIYLSLSFTLLYSITVLQSISCLTTEAEQNHILHIIINCIKLYVLVEQISSLKFDWQVCVCVCVYLGVGGGGAEV